MREGQVVAGKYRIGRLLGSGAMGTVFAAHHILLDQKVAIKFLVPEYLGHSDSVARFVREARATATLKSEHVVRVLDVALSQGGGPYIVMEYLDGSDLAAWLRAHGPPAVDVGVEFVLQACEAIAEAHDLGIIHRDVKPANLFAVQRGGVVETIKVLDFGISKTAGLVSSTAPPGEWRPSAIITEERVPIGSPCYMSPEQMESARDVDSRTDIWALGVTLCEFVTGHLPFEGQSLVQVYTTIKSGARLRAREGVAPGLEAVIRKCLEPNRDRRYSTVGELQAALVPFRSHDAGADAQRRSGFRRETGGKKEISAGDPPSGASPSPSASRPTKGDATLVSAELGLTQAGPKLRMTKIAALGSAVLIVVAGSLVLVPKDTTRAASATALSSKSLMSARDGPGAPTGEPIPPIAATAQNGPSHENSPTATSTAPTAAPPAPSEARRMRNPPPSAGPASARQSTALSGTSAAQTIHDSGQLTREADSESPSEADSSTSSRDEKNEWVPPNVQR